MWMCVRLDDDDDDDDDNDVYLTTTSPLPCLLSLKDNLTLDAPVHVVWPLYIYIYIYIRMPRNTVRVW